MNFNSLLLQLPEITAVVFAILYLALAIKQNILCWTAWILSSCLYTFVMYSAGLYMEALLQIFYVGMGIYGWHQWLNRNSSKQELSISTWQPAKHASAVTLIFVLAYVSGLLLEKYTAAALPFLDAFTTWGAIVTTYMVANKVLENWIYWFVIDSISIYLFISRGLYFTAFLFIIYLFMIVVGYRTWQQSQVSIND
jgi:nicotinamide mononucleotide transporter